VGKGKFPLTFESRFFQFPLHPYHKSTNDLIKGSNLPQTSGGMVKMNWIFDSTPVLAIALVAAVITLSAFIRSYHKRQAPPEEIITAEEAEPIVS
jgi:hypothetical protein